MKIESKTLVVDITALPPHLTDICPLEARSSIPQEIFAAAVSVLNEAFQHYTKAYQRRHRVKEPIDGNSFFPSVIVLCYGLVQLYMTIRADIRTTSMYIQPAVFITLGAFAVLIHLRPGPVSLGGITEIIAGALPKMNNMLSDCRAEFKFINHSSFSKTSVTDPHARVTIELTWDADSAAMTLIAPVVTSEVGGPAENGSLLPSSVTPFVSDQFV